MASNEAKRKLLLDEQKQTLADQQKQYKALDKSTMSIVEYEKQRLALAEKINKQTEKIAEQLHTF